MTKKLVNIKKPVKVTIVFDDGSEQSFDQAVGIFANENNKKHYDSLFFGVTQPEIIKFVLKLHDDSTSLLAAELALNKDKPDIESLIDLINSVINGD